MYATYRNIDKYEPFIQQLAQEIIEKIAKHTYKESAEHEIISMQSEMHCIFIGLAKLLAPSEDLYEVADTLIESLHEKELQRILEDDNYAQEIIQCRRCQKNEKRSNLRSGAIKVFLGESIYVFLCDECVTEITYQYAGLIHTCVLCNKRHKGYTRHELQLQGIPDKILYQLCKDCWHLPNMTREAKRVYEHNIRASLLNLPATLTIKQWMTSLAYFDWQCAYCGSDFTGMEHFVPLSHGSLGTSADNCVPSCGACNTRKNNRHPDDFGNLFPAEALAKIQAWLEQCKP